MSNIDDLLEAAIRRVGPKPADSTTREVKKRYSEQVSAAVALALGAELRQRGLKEARPALPGEVDSSGAERRMAGGIGAKKVDVTWATEVSGLLLGISVKTINFKDAKTGNFQKNLTNRRSDMLIEAVTLHRRFPYAVLVGLFFFDKGAEHDGTAKRRSTFANAHTRLKLFTGRADPAGRDEQYERLYLLSLDAAAEGRCLQAYEVGRPEEPIPLEQVLDRLIELLAERNPDFYEANDGRLISISS